MSPDRPILNVSCHERDKQGRSELAKKLDYVYYVRYHVPSWDKRRCIKRKETVRQVHNVIEDGLSVVKMCLANWGSGGRVSRDFELLGHYLSVLVGSCSTSTKMK